MSKPKAIERPAPRPEPAIPKSDEAGRHRAKLLRQLAMKFRGAAADLTLDNRANAALADGSRWLLDAARAALLVGVDLRELAGGPSDLAFVRFVENVARDTRRALGTTWPTTPPSKWWNMPGAYERYVEPGWAAAALVGTALWLEQLAGSK